METRVPFPSSYYYLCGMHGAKWCLKSDSIRVYISYLFHDVGWTHLRKGIENYGIVDNGTYAIKNDVNRQCNY